MRAAATASVVLTFVLAACNGTSLTDIGTTGTTGSTGTNGQTPAVTGPGLSWRAVTPPAGGTGWYGVAFGNGIYSVVGSGIRGASYTGNSWTASLFTTTPYYFASSLVFANGTFMAPTGLNVTSSTTGLSWSAVTLTNAQAVRALTYGAGKWVGVDDRFLTEDRLAFYTSSNNGVSWQQTVTTIGYAQPTGIAHGNGVFVAVGYGGLVATSPDGTSWTRRSFNATSTDFGVQNVVFANNVFLAPTNSGVVFKSSDGVTWTRIKVTVNALYAATYGGGVYVVVGNASAIWSSTDATVWTQRTFPGPYTVFRAVAYSSGQFVAVGSTFAVSP